MRISLRSPLCAAPTKAPSLCPEAIFAHAIRTASTPAASSPIKVRDDPDTPWTIDMLPASRLDSCARNRVGRRSFISRSLPRPSVRQRGQNRGVDIEVALPAARSDDHVGPSQDFLVVLDARGIQRESGCVGTDALPWFHLALVALLRNLAVKINWRQRVDHPRCIFFQIDVYATAAESVPIRFQPVPQGGDEPNAGYPCLTSVCRKLRH